MERQLLTNPQIEFIKFLGNRKVSEKEINDIKRLVSLYYLKLADTEIEEIWREKQLSDDKMNEILNSVI